MTAIEERNRELFGELREAPPERRDEVRNRIVEANLPLVRVLASRFRRDQNYLYGEDDLYQEGVIGLTSAIRTYDPSRSVPFGAYARMRVHGAIKDSIRHATGWRRSVRPGRRISMEHSTADDVVTLEFPSADKFINTDEWWTATLRGLVQVERDVLVKHYREGKSWKQVAKELRVGIDYVFSVRNRALRHLKNLGRGR